MRFGVSQASVVNSLHGRHSVVPVGPPSGMYAPQQVHFARQYWSASQVDAPH